MGSGRAYLTLVAGLMTVLLLAAGCGGDSSTGPGLILCGATNQDGWPQGLNIIRPDTGQVATIDTGFLVPEAVAAQRGTALYQDFDSGEWFFVDAFEASATLLDIDPEALLNVVIPRAATARTVDLVVLATLDGSGPGVLVDMATGQVTDLGAVMADPPTQIFIVDFDSSGEYALLGDLNSLWLVPTAAPEQTRLFADAWVGDLSSDGKHLVYVIDGEVFLESIDDGSTTSIAGDAQNAFLVDGGVLVLRRNSVAFYDGSTLETLWEGSRLQASAFIDTAESNAVVEMTDEDFNSLGYLHIDPGSRRVTELDTGEVWQPTSWSTDHLLLWRAEQLPDTVLPVVVEAAVIDLSNAAVANIEIPSQGLRPESARWSPDGRLVLTTSNDHLSSWLIDVAAATSTEIAGETQGFAFSPGGARVAVVEVDGESSMPAELVIYDTGNPSEPDRLGVACVNPIWVTQE